MSRDVFRWSLMSVCDKCEKSAFTLATPDLKLCKSCFSHRIEKRVRKTIKQYKMLYHGAHVAVGLSGGKDSVSLLSILSKVVRSDIHLTAIIVDEGIKDYRPEGIQIAITLAKKLNISFLTVSYEDLFGIPLDDMLIQSPFGKSSCAICGTFRRKALNFGALQIKADFLAMGHNLDDEAESIQLNLLRGDTIRFSRLSRTPQKKHPKFVPRIKPLVLVSQPEIVYYALANNLEYHEQSCPYSSAARRNSVREYLTSQEEKHPGTLKSIIRFHDKMLDQLNNVVELFVSNVYECQICGDPTDNKEFCMGCRLLIEMNIDPKSTD